MTRTLSLHRESLTELTTDQLAAVVGGHAIPTSPVRECYEELVDTLQATRCFCP